MTAQAILRTELITKNYQGNPVIENISLEVGQGEIVALIGQSGVGKSTLFNLIAGISQPDGGRVWLKDEDITGQAGKISYMQQKDLLLPYKTVLENVALPFVLAGKPRKEALNQAKEHFPRFGLTGTENYYPSQLSGGMRQRAALLRTWLFGGQAALLDEPFSALDPLTRRQMHNWYLHLMEELALPSLLITHDVNEAVLLADRVYVMAGNPGKIVFCLPIKQKRPRPDDFELSALFSQSKGQLLVFLMNNADTVRHVPAK